MSNERQLKDTSRKDKREGGRDLEEWRVTRRKGSLCIQFNESCFCLSALVSLLAGERRGRWI